MKSEESYSGLILISILTFGIGMFIGAMAVGKHEEQSKAAQEQGCEYLGSPRGVSGVVVYNCSGKIELKLSNEK